MNSSSPECLKIQNRKRCQAFWFWGSHVVGARRTDGRGVWSSKVGGVGGASLIAVAHMLDATQGTLLG